MARGGGMDTGRRVKPVRSVDGTALIILAVAGVADVIDSTGCPAAGAATRNRIGARAAPPGRGVDVPIVGP